MTPEELTAYLTLTGAVEIELDFTRITGTQMERILTDRLGLAYADIEHPLDWYYLADTDSYILQHGDTNAQSFVCLSGVREQDLFTLDCRSEMTGETCRVTLRQAQNGVLQFVSNENLSSEAPIDTGSDSPIYDGVYQNAVSRIGQDAAVQLRLFAENYAQWIPLDWELSPGSMDFAIYDLDGDGRLELLRTQIQGTMRFSDSHFYQAEVESGQIYELAQQSLAEGFAPELYLQHGFAKTPCAYLNTEGKLLYPASDYSRNGIWSASRTDGYYYLEAQTIINVPVRSSVTEYEENGEENTTYRLPDQDAPVTAEVWETAGETFLADKTAKEIQIGWKSLYEEDIMANQAKDWFLLLTESLEEGK